MLLKEAPFVTVPHFVVGDGIAGGPTGEGIGPALVIIGK